MNENSRDETTPPDSPPGSLGTALRSITATRSRRWLSAITLLIGLIIPILLSVTLPASDQTFASIASPTQALMSVTVPCVGVLLAAELRRATAPVRLIPTLAAAVAAAAAVGAYGSATSAIAVVATPATEPWGDAAIVAASGPLLQSSAMLVGTGLGLLLRPSLVACLATVVLPLGAWALLGLPADGAAQPWLTPFGAAQNLLAGLPIGLAQWLAVAVLWSGGLNLLGAIRLRGVGPRR
ncbi:hypothetical protein [Stackebrandtia nassauensis]|uniref:Uncharacterized protein n=1 Tax=Stackebrandtia nassauensis (strain DSM 44728 / CIP 108903 / NRRL B-16338 / NBRC 102104 / LLR-40K-21) TaxID=446470 RepID=D3QAR4_STANL|nr:hypothetical protein [Stackebrandtia nassauensis]ADD44710.1 hypothetical protein Snas_5074 [Stackebrandtia nassauensis DSM 44728]